MAERPQFQVQMKGADVTPDTVRASDLAVFLKHIDGAITETAKSQQIEFAYMSDIPLVSLVHIAKGSSSDLTLSIIDASISPAVSLMTEAIAERKFAIIPSTALKDFHELSNHAVRKK